MGLSSLKNRVILLPDAKMDYTPKEIRKFVDWWNEGIHITEIAKRMYISTAEVALIMIHCELEGWIEPREGGIFGTVPRKKGKHERGLNKQA
jgi:hypothetical protein